MAVRRIFRGGSWFSRARVCRCAYRNRRGHVYRYDNIGFRLVAELSVKRVIHGGSWGGEDRYCRCVCRPGLGPDLRYDFLGFRLGINSA